MESSQSQSSYEAAATLKEFELKKILIDKECYEGLIKSYDLDKTIFTTYGKVYSLKRSRKDKDKDKDPSAGSDRGNSVQSKEQEFEVADSDISQDQEENPSKDDEKPKEKTPQQGQNQSWLMTLTSSTENPSKTFDELMSTLIDFSAFIMNGLKINNLTQETLLGPAFILLKDTRSNYAKLEYAFKEYYKALSEKLDWENPDGSDYSFDLTKPLPLVMSGNRQKGEVIRKHVYGYLKEIVVRRADNDLYRFKEGDFLRLRINHIEDMLLLVVQNRLTNLSGDDVSDFAIALRMFTRSLVIQKRVKDLQLGVKSYQKKITKPETTKSGIKKGTHTLHIKTLKDSCMLTTMGEIG
ncbi:hypothetical protein Tco_0974678 [Tanacetum coccineum]|uniref:Uncharacterized protein n=1 Tax=Tanacetum coccineum TaxID=301880 RepID=A0ABQ5ECF4_9ASTR